MREMQERAFAARTTQYLLIKAPTSGKSRALMFIAICNYREREAGIRIIAYAQTSVQAVYKLRD